MSKNYNQLKQIFENIKNLGWVETHRTGDTGIGKTFEDLLGKIEDNASIPDFKDIELKTQRDATNSMITLFTKSPDYPKGVNTLIREKFGNSSSDYDGKKILHTTINAKSFNTHVSGNDFKILIDREFQRLILQVRRHETKIIIYDQAYWSFKKIEHALDTKLKYVAYVTADEKKIDGKNYFKFTTIKLITGLTLENFLCALENGDIMVDVRIGVYNSGKNKGKTHDHGTGFRIKLDKLINYADITE